MNSIEFFDANNYAVMSGVLNEQQCEQLTNHMFNLYDEGKLIKDPQCPLSDSVYGDPIFDNLLDKLAGPIGERVGKTLLPTYTYSRIYRPGEILKRHKDRPACEISATLTLGYKANSVWPIMFDDEKEICCELEVGEMAVYKGCDITHWRAPFKGEWHVQVFLHYVDANGPHADQAKDGRQSLGIHKPMLTSKPISSPVKAAEKQVGKYEAVVLPSKDDYLPGYFPINSETNSSLMFTKQECEKIISLASDQYSSTASVGSDVNSRIAKQIRSADIYDIKPTTENKWIFEKVIKSVDFANKELYDFEINSINGPLQLIHYRSDTKVKGHYDWHVDAGNGHAATRKISFTAQLSDPDSYRGCDLMVNDHCNEIQAVREQGSISLFPSYMPHVVTPIKSGERFALVIWIHGSRRFR